MKKIINNFWKKSVAKLLVSYVLVIIIPLAIVMVGFQIAFGIVKSTLKETYLSRLSQSTKLVESELNDIETMALQMSQAPNIVDMEEKVSGDNDYITTAMDAIDEFVILLNYKTIDLFKAKESYIYYRKAGLVLFDSSYYKLDLFKRHLENWGIDYDEWYSELNESDYIKPEFRMNGNSFEYIFPISKYLFGEPEAIIVLRVDKDKVLSEMKNVNMIEGNTYYLEIKDFYGNTVWKADALGLDESMDFENLSQDYYENNGLSIIKTKSDKLGWTFIMAIPVDESLRELRDFKTTIIIIIVLAIIAALIQAVYHSVKRGKPMDEAIEAAIKNRFSLQKHFFDNLLSAEFSSEANIEAEAKRVGLDIENQIFQTAYIQFFSENDFVSLDESTIDEIKRLSSLIKEHLTQVCGTGNVWFHKKNYKTETAIFAVDNLSEDVIDIISSTRLWLNKNYGADYISGIGGTCDNLLLVWRSMEEAGLAMENCNRENQVVAYQIEMVDSNKYYLPKVAEEKLSSCLESGQWQDAKIIISLIETENTANRHLNRHQVIKLNQKIMSCMNELIKTDDLKEKILWLNEVMMDREINQKEYFLRLNQVARKICNENVEKKMEQKMQLVDDIKNYINVHFCDSDMGLSRVGSEFHVSETYLSTLFKEQSGGNFADYIEKLRIEKACELLQENKLTVNEISMNVGYNSVQSFRRAFKRVKGISPKEAR